MKLTYLFLLCAHPSIKEKKGWKTGSASAPTKAVDTLRGAGVFVR